MFRAIAILLAVVFSRSALAQDYGGLFVTDNPQGGTVTLQLMQDGSSNVSGVLRGNGNTFQVTARATPQGLMGTVSGVQGSLYILARQESGGLMVILAEPAADGQIRPETVSRLMFTRREDGAPRTPAPGQAQGPASAPPNGGVDGQLTGLLTGSAWCGFTFNTHTGTSSTERVVFQGNGLVYRSTGAETYNSGAAGSVAGQYSDGEQGRWRVANGSLHLSEDGVNWVPLPLQITRNSNGAPIIKADGREYMQCQ